MRKFLADALIGVLVCGTITAACFGLLLLMPMGLVWALAFSGVFAILFIGALALGPIVVVSASALKGRPGLACGPILAIAIAAACLFGVDFFYARSLASLNQRQFLAASKQHTLVKVPLDGRECTSTCLQLLTQTHYTLAMRNKLYRPIQGSDCFLEENIESLLHFTRYGYAGKCAASSEAEANHQDALIFKKLTERADRRAFGIPDNFRGSFIELIERVEGNERILGRWVGGNLGWIYKFNIGESFSDREFYNRALGINIAEERFPGRESLLLRVQSLDRLLDDDLKAVLSWKAASDYTQLLIELHGQFPADAKGRVVRLLQSKAPIAHSYAAFALAPLVFDTHMSTVQELIRRALQDDNSEVLRMGLQTLLKLPGEKRQFANSLLPPLALSIAMDPEGDIGLGVKARILEEMRTLLAISDVPFSPQQLEAAQNTFNSARQLSPNRKALLQRIISLGTETKP